MECKNCKEYFDKFTKEDIIEAIYTTDFNIGDDPVYALARKVYNIKHQETLDLIRMYEEEIRHTGIMITTLKNNDEELHNAMLKMKLEG